MKRFILSLAAVSISAIALAPAAFAIPNRQASSPNQLGEGTSLTTFVQYNRDARSKK